MQIEGLTRYVESFSADNRYLKRVEATELKEKLSKVSSKLKESINSEADPKGWWVPISFYNKKNGNGRIYTKKLWENVINNQRDTYVGAPMLTDHPEGDSDGSPKDICGIWLDAKMDPPDYNGVGLVYGLLVPSGRLGDDLKSHLMNGMKIGTSSSGFGKMMSDGVTVDPDSYMIERLADFVLNPSQGTYFSYDESDNDVVDHSRYGEKLETVNKNLSVKENIVKDSKLTKLEEEKFRRDMESFLESADNIGDPQERLEEYRDIRSYLEDGACPDLKEKVEQKIKEQEEFIKTALKEKIELKEELEIESPKDLKKKLTKIAEDAAILDQDAKEWKKVAEKLQEKYNNTKEELAGRHTNAYVEFQAGRIKSLEESLKSQKDSTKGLIKDLRESYDKVKNSLIEANKNIKSLTSEKSDISEKCRQLEEQLSGEKSARALIESQMKDVLSQLEESKQKQSDLTKIIASQRKSIEENMNVISSLKEKNISSKKMASSYASSLKKAEKSLDNINRSRKMAEQKAKNNTTVYDYYESLYESYGNDIVDYKDEILSSVNLTEAKRKFFTDILGNLKVSKDINKLTESKTTPVRKLSSSVDRMPEGWF